VEFEFVPNEKKFWEFIRLLRTNLLTSSGFVEQVHISPRQQIKYMTKYEKCYYICLFNGDPVGFIGSVDGDIRIATLPGYQRRGVGTFMVNELMKISPKSFAKIKVDNEVSLKFFKKLGFEQSFYIMEKKP